MSYSLPDFTSIYKITNLINGKIYIGVTKMHISDRFTMHKYDAIIQVKPFPLARAIRKYGKDNFKVETLYCSKDEEFCKLIMEPYFIGLYDSYNYGYNATLGGQAPVIKKRSIEATQRSADARRGMKRTAKQRENISRGLERFNYKIIYPDGKEIQITNLNRFCKENNLSQGCMGRLALSSKERKQHKGFKCLQLERIGRIL